MERYFPHDIILIKNNSVLCVVKRDMGKKALVHPKYILVGAEEKGYIYPFFNEKWKRVSNPVASDRENNKKYEFLKAIGEKDYLVRKKDVSKYFSSFKGAKSLVKEKEVIDKHRKITRSLIIQLSKYIPLSEIGITGSTLLCGQKYGWSDIDIVIKKGRNYEALHNALFSGKIKGARVRGRREWQQFYKKYSVYCALPPEEFASHMISKVDQFIYHKIPVSVFFVDPDQNKEDKFPTGRPNIIVPGRVIDDKKSMFLPSKYKILIKSGKKLEVVSNDRAYLSQAKKGDYIEVKGFLKRDKLLVRENGKDYIRRKNASNKTSQN